MSLLSRADLVRALAEDPVADPIRLAQALGYEKGEVDTKDHATGRRSARDNRDSLEATFTQDRQVLYEAKISPYFWYAATCERLNVDEPSEAADWPDRISSSPLEPRQATEPHLSLLTPGQWQNLWDRALPQRRFGRRIDLPRCLKLLAQAKPLGRLPRQWHQTFSRNVTLILDRSEALWPIWPDMLEGERSLKWLIGEDDFDTYHLPGGPNGPCYRRSYDGTNELAELGDIEPDSIVVLIGAFGGLHTGNLSHTWLRTLNWLQRHAVDLVLLPVCPLNQICYRSVPLDPMFGSSGEAENRALESLLSALSQAFRISRSRLRRIRKAIPGANLHTELLAHNHPELEYKDGQLRLLEHLVLQRLKRFAGLPDGVRDAVARQRDQWQQYLNSLEKDAEKLQCELASEPVPELTDYPSLLFQARFVGEQKRLSVSDDAFVHLRTLLPLIRQMVDRYPAPQWQSLYRVAQRVALQSGQPLPLYHEGLAQSRQTHSLLQAHDGLRLVEQSLASTRALLRLSAQAFCKQTRSLLAPLTRTTADPLDIIDNGFHYRLEQMQRPAWAERIWQDVDGLHAAHIGGSVFRLLPAGADRPSASWHCVHNALSWAIDQGVDDYGLWADCELDTDVRFRLRWIVPGSFMMGSPRGEVDRKDDETQHPVRLTQGYWLGETSVSQAVWAVIMDNNPSHFNGADLPVEQVSWQDCQTIIDKLQQRLPSLSWRLPTEAEWEYACRAGGQDVFTWGDKMHTGLANYNGQYSYADGETGEYRARTMPVKIFEPNRWGLYQMHGNVWEWCQDWYGEYPSDSVDDPTGPVEGRERVLRGGSWLNLGRDLRSALRNAIAPDLRSLRIGLRLAGGSDPQAGSEAMGADRWPRSGQQGGGHAPNGGLSGGEKA